MKNLIIFITIFLIVTGCEKKERILYLSDDVKKNFSYKQGSYWVYRDSISGSVDSCYVIDYRIYFREIDYTSYYAYEDYDKVQGISMVMNFVALNKGNKINIDFRVDATEVDMGGIFNPQPKSNGSVQDNFNCNLPISPKTYQSNPVNYLTFINVSGVNFDKVFEVQSEFGMFYINESLGLIKIKTIYDSVSYNWELIRHNVVKP
jgi:hypothetical protein